MRRTLSLCLTASILAACSDAALDTAQAQEPIIDTTPAMLDVILARVTGGTMAPIDGLAQSCQRPNALAAAEQSEHVLINSRLTDDGRLVLHTATWNAEFGVYRTFDIKPGGARVEAGDGALMIRGDYQHVGAMNFMLDPTGEVTFAGPPPIELPVSIACADPVGAINALQAQTGDLYLSATLGLNEHVAEFRTYLETDPRFDEINDACGENTDSKLIGVGYTDSPSDAYPDQFYATKLDMFSGGAEFLTLFFPRYKISIMQNDGTMRLASDGETASGHSKSISENGPSSENNSFEEVEAGMTFGCDNPARAAAVINGANRWIREGRSEPRPLSFSVDVDNNDLNCSLSAASLTQSLSDTAWTLGLKPTLDFQSPDLRVTAMAVAENADSQTGCEYRATLSADWLAEELDPYPARNQNYEMGTEVVDQGFSQAIEALWKQ